MSNPQKENGYDICNICQKKYHISDPKTFQYNNKSVICKYCFIIVFNEMQFWGANRKQRIVFDYIKVSIPHSLKWKVWKRDNFTCKICMTRENLSVDHITPESYGGSLDIDNLQTLCRSCNSQKSNKII